MAKFYHYKTSLKNHKLPIKYILGKGDKKKFIVTEDMYFNLKNGDSYLIEEGFIFDGATVPRLFWWFIPQLDDRMLAVVKHDHQYVNDYLRDEIWDFRAKLKQDIEMLEWCNQQETNNKIINLVMFLVVFIFGWKIFKRRKNE